MFMLFSRQLPKIHCPEYSILGNPFLRRGQTKYSIDPENSGSVSIMTAWFETSLSFIVRWNMWSIIRKGLALKIGPGFGQKNSGTTPHFAGK